MDKGLLIRRMGLNNISSVNIETTTRCNQKCNMCIRNDLKIQSKDISDMTLLKCLMVAKQFNINGALFSLAGMGEPLLCKNLEDHIRVIKIFFPDNPISVNTNCLLLNREKTKMLFNNLSGDDIISLSVSADSKEGFKKLVGEHYNTVTKNARAFLEEARLLEQKGQNIPKIIIRFIISDYTNQENFKRQWGVYCSEKISINSYTLLSWYKNVHGSDRVPCSSLWKSLSFDVDGYVYPCCFAFTTREKSSLLCGSVYDKDATNFKNKTSPILEERQRQKHNIYTGDCQNCDFWSRSQKYHIKIGGKFY